MAVLKAALLAALVAVAGARDVPSNVRNFYNSVRSKGDCTNKLASGFYSKAGDGGRASYCGDRIRDYNVIYLQGQNGNLVNMDIDCDGVQRGPADDGRCGSSSDTQSITAFQYLVESYGTGQRDLDANAHSYVVFGNDGTKPGWKKFNPRSYGIEPLSVMAVVCGNKMFYGVWADTNGDDGPLPMVGETSISLATACYGTSMNGNHGHDEDDILYIAFPGQDAVPGARGAKWNSQNFNEFENSIAAIGNRLIQRIGGSSTPPPTTPPPSNTCSWPGHCAGASCRSENDCADDLVCRSGRCAK